MLSYGVRCMLSYGVVVEMPFERSDLSWGMPCPSVPSLTINSQFTSLRPIGGKRQHGANRESNQPTRETDTAQGEKNQRANFRSKWNSSSQVTLSKHWMALAPSVSSCSVFIPLTCLSLTLTSNTISSLATSRCKARKFAQLRKRYTGRQAEVGNRHMTSSRE